jgi:hypothetical protein
MPQPLLCQHRATCQERLAGRPSTRAPLPLSPTDLAKWIKPSAAQTLIKHNPNAPMSGQKRTSSPKKLVRRRWSLPDDGANAADSMGLQPSQTVPSHSTVFEPDIVAIPLCHEIRRRFLVSAGISVSRSAPLLSGMAAGEGEGASLSAIWPFGDDSDGSRPWIPI